MARADILQADMFDASGFITAGGKSSRMGADKAWLLFDDQPLICRVIAAVEQVTSEIAIIANVPGYERLGLPIFADENPGIGPLEAVRTALSNSRKDRVLLVACDLPFVTPGLFQFLLKLSADHQIVVPMAANGMLEPLCAIYSKSVLPAATQLIHSGERKVSSLFDQAATRFVRFDEMSFLRHADYFFDNINTPDDYQRAVRTAERLAHE